MSFLHQSTVIALNQLRYSLNIRNHRLLLSLIVCLAGSIALAVIILGPRIDANNLPSFSSKGDIVKNCASSPDFFMTNIPEIETKIQEDIKAANLSESSRFYPEIVPFGSDPLKFSNRSDMFKEKNSYTLIKVEKTNSGTNMLVQSHYNADDVNELLKNTFSSSFHHHYPQKYPMTFAAESLHQNHTIELYTFQPKGAGYILLRVHLYVFALSTFLYFLGDSFRFYFIEEEQKKIKIFLHLSGLGHVAYWFGNISAILFLVVPNILGLAFTLAFSNIALPFLPTTVLLFGTMIPVVMHQIAIHNAIGKHNLVFRVVSGLLVVIGPIVFSTIGTIPLFLVHILLIFLPMYRLSAGLCFLFHPYALQMMSRDLRYGYPSMYIILIYCAVDLVMICVYFITISFDFVTIRSGKAKVTHSNNEGIKNTNDILNISKVTKRFKNGTVALSKVSFTVKRNEILALLGHNGSGKSTLLNLIANVDRPTTSESSIQNFASDSTSFCSQHDALYDYETVRQHLDLFARLRGISNSSVRSAAIDKIVQELDMASIIDKPCGVLSGGEKRLVCVAIAFIGDPKLVILDEATSGMDPASREHLWGFLRRKQSTSTIMICTHFMDEADLLADRKVLLSYGSVRCVGTSEHFRNVFQCGYSVTVFGPHLDLTAIEGLLSHHHLPFTIAKTGYGLCEYIISSEYITPFIVDLEASRNELGVTEVVLRENGLESIFRKAEVTDIGSNQAMNQDKSLGDTLNKLNAASLNSTGFSSQCTKFLSMMRLHLTSFRDVWLRTLLEYTFMFGFVYLMVYNVPKWALSSKEQRDNGFDFRDKDIFEKVTFGHRFFIDCPSQLESLVPEYMVSKNPSIMGRITCTPGNQIEFISNAAIYAAPQYLSFIAVIMSGKVDNVTFTKADSEMTYSPYQDLKTLFTSFCIAVVMFVAMTRLIAMSVTDQTRIKFMSFTFGIHPVSFYLSVLVRNLIYLSVPLSAVYMACHVNESLEDISISIQILYFVMAALVFSTFPIMMSLFFVKTSTPIMIHNLVFVVLYVLLYLHPMFGESFIKVFPWFTLLNPVLASMYYFHMKLMMRSVKLEFSIQNMGIIAAFSIAVVIIFEMRHILFYWPSVPKMDVETTPRKDGLNVSQLVDRRHVLKHLQMDVPKEEIYCFLGVNGAGKTTTLRLIMSQAFPRSGRITVFGIDAHKQRFDALAQLGYCPQFDDILTPSMSGRQHIHIFLGLLGVQDTKPKDLIVDKLASSLVFTTHVDKPVSELSGGTKRKITLAISMIAPSRLLILDEPTTGVDAAARDSMWHVMRSIKSQKAILVTTHYLREAELADRMGILAGGRIVFEGNEFQLCSQVLRNSYHLRAIMSTHMALRFTDLVQQHLNGKFTCETVLSNSKVRLMFEVGSENLSLANALQLLDAEKESGRIESYSLSKEPFTWDDIHAISESSK